MIVTIGRVREMIGAKTKISKKKRPPKRIKMQHNINHHLHNNYDSKIVALKHEMRWNDIKIEREKKEWTKKN